MTWAWRSKPSGDVGAAFPGGVGVASVVELGDADGDVVWSEGRVAETVAAADLLGVADGPTLAPATGVAFGDGSCDGVAAGAGA